MTAPAYVRQNADVLSAGNPLAGGPKLLQTNYYLVTFALENKKIPKRGTCWSRVYVYIRLDDITLPLVLGEYRFYLRGG